MPLATVLTGSLGGGAAAGAVSDPANRWRTGPGLPDRPQQPDGELRQILDVKVIATNLTNDTELTWAATQEADLDHYEVVWRPTTEENWTNVVDVGRDTRVVVDLSKARSAGTSRARRRRRERPSP